MLASEVARETALLAVAAVLSALPVRVILLGLARPLPQRLVTVPFWKALLLPVIKM